MRERRERALSLRLRRSRSARLRAKFAAECRRQSRLTADDPAEREILDWMESVADIEGWDH